MNAQANVLTDLLQQSYDDHQQLPDNRIRVLAIDDQVAERMRLVALLTKLGFDVTDCSNGEDAFQLLCEQDFDIVVSDWRMPKMTGLELCQQVRNLPGGENIYFILLTANDTKVDLVAGMDAGADDFITKPYSADEVRVRVQAGVRIINLQSSLKDNNHKLENAMKREQAFNRQTRNDLQVAATMQQALLPEDATWKNGYETASMFHAATGVAGDMFNSFMLGNRHLAFYHLDVAGHGIPSAMLSFTLSRTLLPEVGDLNNLLIKPGVLPDSSRVARPAEVIAELNRKFQDYSHESRFFTIVYGVVDLETGKGELCQAGHPHPLVCDSQGTVSKLGDGGLPVGVFEVAEYTNIDFKLEPGSSLILYSDGAPECLSQGREPFGDERLQSLIAKNHHLHANETIKLVEGELNVWLGDSDLEDDISAFVICRQAEGE